MRETMATYLTRCVKTYLEGTYDWKWIVTIMNQSGFNKHQARQLLFPLREYGWKSRSEALFSWLETR